jgi:type I restriction enzyme S subunit
LKQYLISSLGQSQIDQCQAGGNRQGLNFQQIRSFSIPLPPTLDEQRIIASALQSADEFLSEQASRLETLKNHKLGLLQQLFPILDEVDG